MAGIILHNLSTRKQTFNISQAHKGKVSGLCFSPGEGERLLSCGVDRNVKLWSTSGEVASSEKVRSYSKSFVTEN